MMSPRRSRSRTVGTRCRQTNLIKHSQGWLLWDTGLADTVAAMPDGLRPADPRAILWRRPKTLAAQLDQLGVKPADIKYVAVSHSHPDHIGNVDMFPLSMLLVQKTEYEDPAGSPPRFKPELPVTKLEGDRDVFGDGSVTIIATPGHTAGHQSLLVKLPKTGAALLSGDAVHFKDNWDNRRVPSINFSQEQARASMKKIPDAVDPALRLGDCAEWCRKRARTECQDNLTA